MNTEQETLTLQADAPAVDRRYPIGPFHYHEAPSPEKLDELIAVIEAFPARFRKLIARYSEEQLDTPYRENGWTIRQVVHHVADSHLNGYTRFKLSLTEDKPTIKPYNEKAWAEMMDAKSLPVQVSLDLIENLHMRWVAILHAMDAESFRRSFFHPEHMKMHDLNEYLAMYAWHCNHHYAHIQLVEPLKKAPAVKKLPGRKSDAKKKAAGKKK